MNLEDALAFNMEYFTTIKRYCQPHFCRIIFGTCIFFHLYIDKSKKKVYDEEHRMNKGVRFRIGEVSCTKMSAFAFCF